MSSRTYLCMKCGTLRRGAAIYRLQQETWDQLKASSLWPKHRGLPMKTLTFQQGVVATHVEGLQRVKRVESGLHIIQRASKRKWMPALNVRQIAQAKQQIADFLAQQLQG